MKKKTLFGEMQPIGIHYDPLFVDYLYRILQGFPSFPHGFSTNNAMFIMAAATAAAPQAFQQLLCHRCSFAAAQALTLFETTRTHETYTNTRDICSNNSELC